MNPMNSSLAHGQLTSPPHLQPHRPSLPPALVCSYFPSLPGPPACPEPATLFQHMRSVPDTSTQLVLVTILTLAH